MHLEININLHNYKYNMIKREFKKTANQVRVHKMLICLATCTLELLM